MLSPRDVDPKIVGKLVDAAGRAELGLWLPVAVGAVVLAAETGMRPGELYVLRGSDLDHEKGEFTVERAWTVEGGVGTPKNGKRRTGVLTPAASAAARAAWTRSRELGAADDLVLCTPLGEQLTHRTWPYYWRTIRLLAGLPSMRFYDLRHLCASKLLDLGVARDLVALQLGHSDGGDLVTSTYGHPDEDRQRQRIREALEHAA
jgi:integrase